MREYKYRVWDEEEKKFYYTKIAGHSGDGLSVFVAEEGYVKGKLTEWTGLKDKNGKDIYEGDIVVNWWISSDGKTKVNEGQRVIEFKFGCFGYQTKGIFPHWYSIHNKLEIIGNIFQNPELLKEKK